MKVDQISAPRVARLELLHGAEQAEHEKGRPVVNREWMACQPSLRPPVCAAPGAGSGGRRGRFQTPSSPNVFLENFSASSAFQIVSASSFRTRPRALQNATPMCTPNPIDVWSRPAAFCWNRIGTTPSRKYV